MITLTEVLNSYEIDRSLTGLMKAVKEVEKDSLCDGMLLNRIQSIVGQGVELPEIKDVKTFYKYLLQNIIDNKDYEERSSEVVGDLLMLTNQKVSEFNDKFEWTKPEVIETKKKEQNKEKKVTKKSRAIDIFVEHFGKITPKEVQQMFKDQLDMTTLGARTYYYTIKGELKDYFNDQK